MCRRDRPSTADVAGSAVTTYTYGADLYADMLAAIRGAKRVIFFETFIWKGDEVGAEFKTALIEAAARGVHVYVAVSYTHLDVYKRQQLGCARRWRPASPALRCLAGWRLDVTAKESSIPRRWESNAPSL